MDTLQLNADYTPMKVIPWQRAIELVLDAKAVTVAPYTGRFVRSTTLVVPWPAVVSLRRYSRPRGRVGFSGRHVLARDGYTCAYCGVRAVLAEERAALTVDHVVPRAQAKHGAVYLPWSRKWVNVTCWENVVTACRACNARKADRSPTQAGMPLRALPRSPSPADVLRMSIGRRGHVPVEWEAWLPERWRETTPRVELAVGE